MFKLTVMFFSLINLFIIFQIIINKILQNLINIKKVISFMDNILIEIENKEEHNKIVKEVVRKLVKNNLYIKLEKYK